MNYNERVRILAEEMVRCRYIPQYWNDIKQSPNGQAEIEATKHYAHITVKYIADAVQKVLYEVESDGAVVDRYLEQEGLIPDSDPEIVVVQPGDRMSGKGHNPDNPEPEPEPENWQL